MNYQTAISFGLVHIPVVMNSAIKNNDISFNMLHKKCGEKVNYIRYCNTCKKEVKNSDLEKGYEYTNGNYITMTDEDFEKLKSENDKIIEIISFVNIKDIDPVYYDKSYTLSSKNSNKAFNLFKEALRKSKKVAIAKTYIRNKAYYVVLRFGYENIIMDTLYYEEELVMHEDNNKKNYTDDELKLATKLIDAMSGEFSPSEYVDEYQTRLKNAIDKKINGEEIKAYKKKKPKNINDLMKALEKSLENKNGKK